MGEASRAWVLLKVVTWGGRAPSKSAMVRGCLVGVAAGTGPKNSKKIPDLCPMICPENLWVWG